MNVVDSFGLREILDLAAKQSSMSRYANVTTYYVAVSHEGLTKHLILYPGIPIEEIQLVLRASFDVDGHIVGVRDKHEVNSIIKNSSSHAQDVPYFTLVGLCMTPLFVILIVLVVACMR